MLKAPRKPNISKTVAYASAVNALQILALLVFVVYVFLMDFSWQNRISLRTIAVVGALVAGWGAILDIQDALLTRRRMRTITELQTVNQQMDALNLKLRAQRHDFLNPLQVVYSLMEMGEYQDATAYLETVYSQLHAVSRVLRTKVTAFNALLQVKNAECERRGIALELDVRSTLEGIAMPAWELCCVIGSLPLPSVITARPSRLLCGNGSLSRAFPPRAKTAAWDWPSSAAVWKNTADGSCWNPGARPPSSPFSCPMETALRPKPSNSLE